MSARGSLRVAMTCVCLLLSAGPAFAQSWWNWLDELSGPGEFESPIVLAAELWCIGRVPPDVQQLLRSQASRTAAQAPNDRQAALTEALSTRRCRADRTNVLLTIDTEFARWNDIETTRYVGDTRLRNLMAIGYVSPYVFIGPPGQSETQHRLVQALRAFEFGAGFGAYRLTGFTIIEPSEQWWRGVVPLRLRIIPSELFWPIEGDERRHIPIRHRKLRKLAQAFQYRIGGDFVLGRLTNASFRGLPLADTPQEFVRTHGVQVNLGTIFWAAFQDK